MSSVGRHNAQRAARQKNHQQDARFFIQAEPGQSYGVSDSRYCKREQEQRQKDEFEIARIVVQPWRDSGPPYRREDQINTYDRQRQAKAMPTVGSAKNHLGFCPWVIAVEPVSDSLHGGLRDSAPATDDDL